MTPALFFLIGASGSGKTAVARLLDSRGIPGLRCFYFDSIGIPATATTRRDFGGEENWQALATSEWVNRLITSPKGVAVALLEARRGHRSHDRRWRRVA
jgi:adenylate kinase family enzyme